MPVTAPQVPAYLIVGDDPYLVSEALSEVLEGIGELSVEEFDPGGDAGLILQALASSSMFGGRRAVVVRSLDEFPAEVHRQLASYLEDPNPDCLLVLVSRKSLPGVGPAVRKAGHVVEAGKGGRNELFGWLRKKAADSGLKASGDAVGALVEAVGEERLALAQALEELALALGGGGRLGVEEVRRQFQGRADTRVFAFVDSVASRRRGPALEALHRLLRQGEAPQALFWMLARHFRMLLLAGDGAPARVAQSLGIPAWRAEKLVRQAGTFSQEELIRAYQTLALADHRMKTGEEPEGLTLERAVVSITGP